MGFDRCFCCCSDAGGDDTAFLTDFAERLTQSFRRSLASLQPIPYLLTPDLAPKTYPLNLDPSLMIKPCPSRFF